MKIFRHSNPAKAGAALFATISLLASLASHAALLTPGEPVLLQGTKKNFDFIRMDAHSNRLLLGHSGNKSFDVFDIASNKLLKSVATSTAQDATVDEKRGFYYVSGNDPSRMVIVDSTKLEITGEVPTPADTDLSAYNPNTGLVYDCNDTAGEVWVIDPAAKKITTTIKVDGSGVEDLAFDTGYKHLYQAIKGTSTIAVIDPVNTKIGAVWTCAPDKSPHGIAYAAELNSLLVACPGNLLMFDCASGKVTSRATVGGKIDEMAYDAEWHRAYVPSRDGKMSVISIESSGLKLLGDVPIPSGTGDVAVAPKTHTVWIAYSKGGECFVQPLIPQK